MKTTVIYHRADFDGIFCREIAKRFLPEAELIGWDHGDEPLPIPEGTFYVMDLPLDRLFGFAAISYDELDICFMNSDGPRQLKRVFAGRVVWIDHHKSSIATHPEAIAGYRIDGVAACRLAWQWFAAHLGGEEMNDTRFLGMPEKKHFVDREVREPWAVRLAGEYDIWDKRDENAELLQHGLRSRELSPDDWTMLLTLNGGNDLVSELLDGGKAIQYAQTRQNESVIREIGFTFQWEGLTFLGCNAARYNSHLFTAGLKPEHDGCFGFKWTGRDWSVSLYGVPGKPDVDLSKIAVKHGGGGHKQACGFRTSELPFLSSTNSK